MSYLDPIDYIDPEEGRDSASTSQCANCGPGHDWFRLAEYTTPEGETITLCHDCGDEERRIEKLADQLAAMPSCEARERIIEKAKTTRQLAHALSAHDLECPVCAGMRKPMEVAQESTTTQERKAA